MVQSSSHPENPASLILPRDFTWDNVPRWVKVSGPNGTATFSKRILQQAVDEGSVGVVALTGALNAIGIYLPSQQEG